jgi:hypothetical protein
MPDASMFNFVVGALAQTSQDGPLGVPVVSIGSIGGEVLNWAVAAFGAPVAALLSAWLLRLFRLAGAQLTDTEKEQLQKIIVNGLNGAAADVSQKMRGKGAIEIKNQIIADAVKYAQKYGAETLKALRVDPQSGEVVAAIRARIETALNDPEQPTPEVITPPSGLKIASRSAAP